MKNLNGMYQEAPLPTTLYDLVNSLTYRPGWKVWLEDSDRGQLSKGLTLFIQTIGFDTYHMDRGETYKVNHLFPVPPASYNKASWQRWLLEQFLLVERHEACEFFTVDNEKPYAPHHGPGCDPYTIFERGSEEEAKTSSGGEVNE